MDSLGSIEYLNKILNERTQQMNFTISEQPDETGCFIVEGDGTMEEFFEQLGCVKLEDAMKRINEIQDENY